MYNVLMDKKTFIIWSIESVNRAIQREVDKRKKLDMDNLAKWDKLGRELRKERQKVRISGEKKRQKIDSEINRYKNRLTDLKQWLQENI